MIGKKHFLLLAFSLLFVVGFLATVSATTVNFRTPLINFTNISGSTYALTIYINNSGAEPAENLIGNVSWYYKPLSYAIPGNNTWFIIGRTTNTSENQSVFTLAWDTTALTDAEDYLINATAYVYPSNVSTVNSTNVTGNITIDNIAPTVVVYSGVDLTAYANGTIKQATINKTTLNISVADATIGLYNSSNWFCFANANGTNQTSPIIGGFCNFTLDLTGATDGNKTINIYVNDSVNNMRNNNTLVIQVDTTSPVATATCTSTSVQAGDSFPCSCSGSDATSGLNSATGISTSPDNIAVPANTGSFTYTCTSTDYGGLTASTTKTYAVTQSGTSVSSGSSSSASATTVQKIQTIASISPDKAGVVTGFGSDMGIKDISFSVSNTVQNVKVTVKKYSSKPEEVSVEKTGDVYQYLQIDATNLADKLEKALITSRVEKSWVNGNSMDKEDVSLFKFNEGTGKWDELSTVYSNEDATYYYYTSEVSSFSYFAIGVKSVENGEETNNVQQPSETEQNSKTSSWIWIIVGVLALAAIAVVVMMKKRKE
jgi:PGF-pre-PGF domain-containing protein